MVRNEWLFGSTFSKVEYDYYQFYLKCVECSRSLVLPNIEYFVLLF